MNKPSASQLAGLLAALVTMSCLSQFYRVSNSVIAPELMRELNMTSQQLGLAGGAVFFTLLLAQIPVGIWFDRYGARITLTCLSVFAAIGAVMVSRAQTANDLIIARAVIGIGCAASYMALVFVLSRWVEPARYTTVLSWGFALSNIGSIAATTPLAWASETIGWRKTFLVLAAITVVGMLIFYTVVRDRPPGAMAQSPPRRPLREEFSGLLTVWRTPGLLPVLAMHTFAYAAQMTILGVWAGPYLFDVYGLDSIARGNILLLMGIAQILGVMFYGPLDRLFGSRKKVIIVAALASIALLVAMAAIERPPLMAAIILLIAVTFISSYGVVIVSQGRALFPANLAGRGVTTVNIAQLAGLMGLPVITGMAVGSFPQISGVAPEIAYRAAFALIAGCKACGLFVYLRSQDSRP